MTTENAAMQQMEDSLDDLQGAVAKAVKPPRNSFKPTGALLTAVVAICVAASVFGAVTRLTAVTRNTNEIQRSCQRRNEAIAAFNAKFVQLSDLFDLVLENRPPGQPPPADVVLKQLEDFRRPVVVAPCN